MKLYKYILSILIISLTSNTVEAQATLIVSGLDAPLRMLPVGSELYFSEAGSGKIRKIDITQSNPPITDIVDGLVIPSGMTLMGNELYISEFGAGRIVKIDITDSNPVPELVLDGFDSPNIQLLDGDILYLTDNADEIVYRIDLSQSTLVADVLITGTHAIGLAREGDYLYWTEAANLEDSIFRIDLTESNPQPEVVGELFEKPNGILIQDNQLIVAEYLGGVVSALDLSQLPGTQVDVVTNLSGPSDVKIIDEFLYICQQDAGSIIRIGTEILSTSDISLAKEVILYPSPVKDSVSISGVQQDEDYAIYSITGAMLKSGTLQKDQSINVEGLSKGLYILRLNDGRAVKFLKE